MSIASAPAPAPLLSRRRLTIASRYPAHSSIPLSTQNTLIADGCLALTSRPSLSRPKARSASDIGMPTAGYPLVPGRHFWGRGLAMPDVRLACWSHARGMQRHAAACSGMPPACPRHAPGMQRHAAACRGMQRHAPGMQRHAAACRGMQGHAAACSGMPPACRGMQGHAPGMPPACPRHAAACGRVLRHSPDCADILPDLTHAATIAAPLKTTFRDLLDISRFCSAQEPTLVRVSI